MRAILAGLATLLIGSAAAAQTSATAPAQGQGSIDWDLRRDTGAKLTVAFSAFDSGLAIGARCSDGAYQVAIAGLPVVTSSARTLRVGFKGEPLEDQTWYVAAPADTAISSFPAPFARRLREGGRMDIVVPGGGQGGRNLRYVLDLPASSRAIDESLAACARPLVDPRDDDLDVLGENGLPLGLEWRVSPRPIFPGGAMSNGFASLSCLTQADGVLKDCVVEAEYPQHAGFGRAALRAVIRARLKNIDSADSPVAVRMINFTTNFCIENACLIPASLPRSNGQ